MSAHPIAEMQTPALPNTSRHYKAILFGLGSSLSLTSAVLIVLSWRRVSTFEDLVGVAITLPVSVIIYIAALRLMKRATKTD